LARPFLDTGLAVRAARERRGEGGEEERRERGEGRGVRGDSVV
jgi:hypothetical protein